MLRLCHMQVMSHAEQLAQPRSRQLPFLCSCHLVQLSSAAGDHVMQLEHLSYTEDQTNSVSAHCSDEMTGPTM